MRKTWFMRFLKTGGLEQVFKQIELTLRLSREMQSSGSGVENDALAAVTERGTNERRFINSMLKLMKIIIFAVI